MPFYKVNGMVVHVKLSGKRRPPAPCIARVGFSAAAAEVDHCNAISAFLCDWKLSTGKTCDAPLCESHANQIGKNRHLCPDHFAQHTHQSPQRSLFTDLVVPKP